MSQFNRFQPLQSVGQAVGSLLYWKTIEVLPEKAICITDSGHTAQQLLIQLKHAGRSEVLYFPDTGLLPYENRTVDPESIALRCKTRAALATGFQGIVVTTASALMQKIAPPAFIAQRVLSLSRGQTIDLNQFCDYLGLAGYQKVSQVLIPGEFSRRGELLTLFIPGDKIATHLRWFDDRLEQIFTDTHPSLLEIQVMPPCEYPTNSQAQQQCLLRLKKHKQLSANHQLVEQIEKTPKSGEHEAILPYWFDEDLVNFLDDIPKNWPAFTLGSVETAAQRYWSRCLERFETCTFGLAPSALWLKPSELNAQISHHVWTHLQSEPVVIKTDKDRNLCAAAAPKHALIQSKALSEAALAFFTEFAGPIILTARSLGGAEQLAQALTRHGLSFTRIDAPKQAQQKGIYLLTWPATESFVELAPLRAVMNETDLLPEAQVVAKAMPYGSNDEVYQWDPSLFILGSPLVHKRHGVGRYKGLQCLPDGDEMQEYCVLEYAEGALLYTPLNELHLIYPYKTTDVSAAPLHKLGGSQWKKALAQSKTQASDIAAELLEKRALKAAEPGIAYPLPQPLYQRFCEAFPYTPTSDQAASFAAVENDLMASTPMERLICGDVGFGKTEVALRAACIVAGNGKQVIVLAPTTLLAQQHFERFHARFAPLGIAVGLISRSVPRSKRTHTLTHLASGALSIVVGTHQLLNSELAFHDVGLVIIDEEHRFGVKQKELARLSTPSVDLLLMTATPIPRTLHHALEGIRSLSLIQTPPAHRLAVQTFVSGYSENLIKDAIEREQIRGGQVYYVLNTIAQLSAKVSQLSRWFPEIKIALAHGQMPAEALSAIMERFYAGEIQVLVCSSIIETGLDVPNANTLIIESADRFGLAQLYQLRGRVGRSRQQGYAYLFYPKHFDQKNKAVFRRFQAMLNCTELGSGFDLAQADMEQRGVGELLGVSQSGRKQQVGTALYESLIEDAFKTLSKQPPKPETVVNLGSGLFIPESYIPDLATRFAWYQAILRAETEEVCWQLQATCYDQFGPFPPPLEWLFKQAEFRARASQLQIAMIDYPNAHGTLSVLPNHQINPATFFELLQKGLPDWPLVQFSLEANYSIRFTQKGRSKLEDRAQFVSALLTKLAQA